MPPRPSCNSVPSSSSRLSSPSASDVHCPSCVQQTDIQTDNNRETKSALLIITTFQLKNIFTVLLPGSWFCGILSSLHGRSLLLLIFCECFHCHISQPGDHENVVVEGHYRQVWAAGMTLQCGSLTVAEHINILWSVISKGKNRHHYAPKVKVNVNLYNTLPKALRYGMCSQGISQFYLHTPRSSANGINHTCLFLPSRSW